MVALLARWFLKGQTDVSDPKVRRGYGMLSGVCGIFFNVLLFIFKFIAGSISGSISITADAFNNLSDAGSSLITLFGFKLSGTKPDPSHPFGHGRFEYICGFTVSLLIILMGFELAKSSVEKILAPEPIVFSVVVIVILVASIAVKLYMFAYNSRLARQLDSPSLKATASDCLSDCVSTAVVLVATLISKFTGVNIDPWCGALVSLFILWQGYNAAKETLSPLLGTPPSKEFVEQIESLVMACPDVLGIHDLVVHDYGPGRVMISLHAEVPGNGNLWALHDSIDLLEQQLKSTLHCEAVIHMDPIANEDEQVAHCRKIISELVKTLDESVTVHDFRMVTGPTHTNLIFDVVVPQRFRMEDAQVRQTINALVKELFGENYFCIITVDKPYC